MSKPTEEYVENQEELVEAWHEAREASQAAKQKIREAEAHHTNCVDAERKAWVAVSESEWVTMRGKKGKFLSMQRSRIADLGGER